MVTKEFESYRQDAALDAKAVLVFKDGDAYLAIGPTFTNLAESDDYAYGDTENDVLANYAAGRRDE
jgi:hypothetical protein